MNVLVTGGAGFVGANLVRLLLQEKFQVRVLDNFSVGKQDYLAGLRVEIIEGDILDSQTVSKAVNGVEGIVHLAAQTGVPGSLENPYRDCEINIIGTLNILEAARYEQKKQGKQMRFIFASSNAPLGKQEPPATEDKAPLPISPYGASKLAGEGYCLAYHGSWGVGTIVLRFANLYGPFSLHKNSVVIKFFKDIKNKGHITIDGDGQQTRDFIFVEDLCQAILLALKSNLSGEVFQIATGIETSILQLTNTIQKITIQDFLVNHGSSRKGDINKNYSQISKASSQLAWTPSVSLESGLEYMYLWFREQIKTA